MSKSSTVQKRKRFVGSSHRAHELQNEAHEELLSDLERMVNEHYGDVTFICKDGERRKAIRSLLMGRCNVLQGMLANGMKETSLSEIHLPEISSPALSCVFEFLYTGTIVNSQPKTWRLLLDVLGAARFFLLPNLEGIMLELVLETVSKVSEDLLLVAAMLTDMLEFSHSCQENQCNAIQRELVRLLSSDWTHSGYVANLSEQALQYLLSQTKCEDNYEQVDDKDMNVLKATPRKQKRDASLVEYYRFRQVILWCVYENFSGPSEQVVEEVESAVPLIRHTSSLCFDGSIDDETAGPHSSLHLKSMLNASGDAATRLFSFIDLQYIHFILFEKVVVPLNCFSSSDILRVCRFHALDKAVRTAQFSSANCSWKLGPSLTVRGDGSSVESRGVSEEAAIALMPLSSKTRIHLWRFVIKEAVSSCVRFGFLFVNADQVSKWDESDCHALFAQRPHYKVVALGYRVVPRGKLQLIVGGRSPKTVYIGKDSHITFQLDFVERNCSLSLNGDHLGICWENLPDKVCYPVVSFRSISSESDRFTYGLIGLQAPRM